MWLDYNKPTLEEIRKTVTERLNNRGLRVNDTKTEEFHIGRNTNPDWKKFKFLGSMLETEEDIKRRKAVTNNVFSKLKHIFTNHRITLTNKIRVFNLFVGSTFLYNSELWTATNKCNNDIDIFQRKLLRRILQIFYPSIISNDDLYKKTQTTPWSKRIRLRRLNWLGHLLRLPTDTPARKALDRYLEEAKRPRGGQKLT
jgi:hypothetical protein